MKVYGTPTSRPTVGLSRIGWVRVDVGGSRPVCHVVGTTGRRMVVRPVSLGTATALMARGVPSVVRHGSIDRRISAHT